MIFIRTVNLFKRERDGGRGSDGVRKDRKEKKRKRNSGGRARVDDRRIEVKKR